jgi:kynurenine formamidase
MTFRLLSYNIDGKTPMYGGKFRPSISDKSSIKAGATANTREISVHTHTGTHVDAPYHFFEDGRKLTEYSLEEMAFESVLVLDIPKKPDEWVEREDLEAHRESLKGADCLLLRTGFSAFRGRDEYETRNPGLSPEAISWARKAFPGLRCIGIDSISISGFSDRERGREAHRAALGNGNPLLIVEDLNLDGITKLKRIFVLPWQISGTDGAPCTVLAEL